MSEHRETTLERLLRTWTSPAVLIAVIVMIWQGGEEVSGIKNEIRINATAVANLADATREDMRDIRDAQRAIVSSSNDHGTRIAVLEVAFDLLQRNIQRDLGRVFDRLGISYDGP